MFQLAAQPPDGAVGRRAGAPANRHRLVHVSPGPFRGAPVVQAQLMVGIPVRGSNPLAEMPRHARDAISGMRRFRRQHVLDFTRELRRHALIGVERQDPVVARDRRRVVFLGDVAGPLAHDDMWREPLRDRHGVVGAAGIDDDQLVGPGDRLQRLADVRRFVPGDDRDRELRHGRSLTRDSGFGIWDLGRSGIRGLRTQDRLGTRDSCPESRRMSDRYRTWVI